MTLFGLELGDLRRGKKYTVCCTNICSPLICKPRQILTPFAQSQSFSRKHLERDLTIILTQALSLLSTTILIKSTAKSIYSETQTFNLRHTSIEIFSFNSYLFIFLMKMNFRILPQKKKEIQRQKYKNPYWFISMQNILSSRSFFDLKNNNNNQNQTFFALQFLTNSTSQLLCFCSIFLSLTVQ